MAVYYKFKSAKDYDTVPVEGHFISVVQLKERIVEKMRLGRQPDFDLLISNAQTNEEYTEDGFLVPKNTSVLVRRVPGSIRMPIVADNKPDQKFVEEAAPPSIEAPPKTNANNSDWGDDFGVDLYEDPETARAQSLQTHAPAPFSTAKMDEEAKIKAFCDSSASEWQRQTQEAYVGGRGLGRGGGQGRGAGRGIGLMRKTPPDGYVCHRCNKPGHYIQHCPTNGDPNYNIKKVKLPTGIPRTMLVANPDGSYAMPNGEIAVLKPNEEVFEKEVDALTSNKVVNDVPSELRCPLCREVLKDAVLTSKCCFKSYCDRCIRNEIITKGRCVCGATNVLADDLLPNKTLRDAIDRLLEANAATSSADNAGSKQYVPDMESALPCVKAPSPAASASLHLVLTAPDGQKGAPEVKDSGVVPQKIVDWSVQSEGLEVESLATKELPMQDGNSNISSKAEEEVQQQQSSGQPVKKNKVKRLRPPKQMMPGQQMPWRGMPPEAMEEGHMMGYGGNPPPYNAFWPPHPMGEGYPMPMGDGYMMPYGGPYNGYGVPYEMQFNGAPMMPDPYAYQGMAPPVPPYPQREYMEYGPGFDYSYGTGRPTSGVMSREEFEAKKAEARRKHASEHHGREHPGDEHDSPAKVEQEASKVRKRPRSTDRSYEHRESTRDTRDHRESTRDHRESTKENSREHRESSRDRRVRPGYGAERSTRNHGDGYSSGDDSKHGHKVEQSEVADSHGTNQRTKSGSQAGPSYRTAYEDSKRKRGVAEAEDSYEDSKRSGRSHSSKRMSVFHRVKQGEEDGAADSDSSARKKSRSHAHHHASERSHHRHENHHHNHVENDNEPLKSVFNRIAYTNSKSHPKKQSAQG